MHIVGDLAHVLLHFFYAHDLVTLFVALIEEAGVPLPIPGDALLMLGGAASAGMVWSDAAGIVVCSAAVVLGSSTLYGVLRRGGRPLLLRYGKYVHLGPRTLGRREGWLVRRGRATIIVGRFIPGLRIPTTVTAGISGVPAASVLITAAIAAPLWSSPFYLLGAVLGRQGPLVTVISAGLLHPAPGRLLELGALLILVGVGGGLWELRRRRRLQHAGAQGAPAVTNMPARQWQPLASARERDEAPATLRGPRLLVMPCCRARADRRSRACWPGRRSG